MLRLELTPTPKLIDWIRAQARTCYLIGFKLQVGNSEDELIQIGLESMQRHGADLVVANDLEQMDGEKHVAYIMDATRRVVQVQNKAQLCEELIERTAQYLRNQG